MPKKSISGNSIIIKTMIKNIGWLLILCLIGCSPSKFKMGGYSYKVKTKRINTHTLIHPPKGKFGKPGDFSTFKWIEKGGSLPIVLTIKELYLNKKRLLGCEVKAQKLSRMSKTDTIYLKGKMFALGDMLICVQQRLNDYLNNSVRIQVMEQEDGSFRFIKAVHIPANEYRE